MVPGLATHNAEEDSQSTASRLITVGAPNAMQMRAIRISPNGEVIDDDSFVQARNGDEEEEHNLKLLFLGCEAKPPYGPYDHTAGLFLDMLANALTEYHKETTTEQQSRNRSCCYSITLLIYYVSQGFFPLAKDLDECDGIILPGSFNSAYDDEPWIQELKDLIQTVLVPKHIPTLGVCFGHQIYAHSFPNGSAIKCQAGPQAGRKTSQLTAAGQNFLKATAKNCTATTLDLFYTHGDMVEKLPPNGVSLGGNENVPTQAAIYYCSGVDSSDGTSASSLAASTAKVSAVTFQAHPEYTSSKDKGLEKTLYCIIDAMKERGDITEKELQLAKEDAILRYEHVRGQSVHVMISACRLLGWF